MRPVQAAEEARRGERVAQPELTTDMSPELSARHRASRRCPADASGVSGPSFSGHIRRGRRPTAHSRQASCRCSLGGAAGRLVWAIVFAAARLGVGFVAGFFVGRL